VQQLFDSIVERNSHRAKETRVYVSLTSSLQFNRDNPAKSKVPSIPIRSSPPKRHGPDRSSSSQRCHRSRQNCQKRTHESGQRTLDNDFSTVASVFLTIMYATATGLLTMDDEELARMLQFEEQKRGSWNRGPDGSHEKRDRELAKQLARRDMQQARRSISRDTDESTDKKRPPDTWRSAPKTYITQPYSRQSPPNQSHRSQRYYEENLNLAHAVELQTQAFSRVDGRKRPPHPDSGREIAMRVQQEGFYDDTAVLQIEPDHLGDTSMTAMTYQSLKPSRQEEEDAELARFMTESGSSIRDLSSAELSDLLAHSPANVTSAPSLAPNADNHAVDTSSKVASQCPNGGPFGVRNPTSPVQQSRQAVASLPSSAPVTPTASPYAKELNSLCTPPVENFIDQTSETRNVNSKNKRERGLGFFKFGARGEKKSSPPAAASHLMDPIPPRPNMDALASSRTQMRQRAKSLSPVPSIGTVSGAPGFPVAPHSPPDIFNGKGNGHYPVSRIIASCSAVCSVCNKTGGSFVAALDRKYHVDCFRCVACKDIIDTSKPFAFSKDAKGQRQAHHRDCHVDFGIRCVVCSEMIVPNLDGSVSFVKHPFFETERMCLRHAQDQRRRCTGCQRVEPLRQPFADLNDRDRCICFACCRTVVVDNTDARPLWNKVLSFFENNLKLPIFDGMRNIPVLMVQSDTLNYEYQKCNSTHQGCSQLMARGLCLTDYTEGTLVKTPSIRFEKKSSSFQTVDEDDNKFYEVSHSGKNSSMHPQVHAILCLLGLPRDLTGSILAHEATHAWMELHPQYNPLRPLPPQVMEGCAQLIAMLFLSDGLDQPNPSAADEDGPSDQRLRQYFKFSIERDDDKIYGLGYRRAALAYRDIGIEALLSHVVRHGSFPRI